LQALSYRKTFLVQALLKLPHSLILQTPTFLNAPQYEGLQSEDTEDEILREGYVGRTLSIDEDAHPHSLPKEGFLSQTLGLSDSEKSDFQDQSSDRAEAHSNYGQGC
jgi:hypothetical protein